MLSPSSDFTPTTELLNGSPKLMVTFFLFTECKEFSKVMRNPGNANIDTATADLLSYCTDTKKREELWKKFVERKDDIKYGEDPQNRTITAALLTKGDFWAYLCEALEFTETSTGGF